ncbi:MAG: hypothetical protein RLY70_3049 [Planctomycetota bacterium]|jgi:hypothetical protein
MAATCCPSTLTRPPGCAARTPRTLLMTSLEDRVDAVRALALWLFGLLLVAALVRPATSAELATLGPDNWDSHVPQGKEVDAIYGDYVLRNDRVVVVVGRPGLERHANLTVKSVGGALLDMTLVDRQNDQLSAYFPGGSRYAFVAAENVSAWTTDPAAAVRAADPKLSGTRVVLQCEAQAVDGRPRCSVRYTLEDGQPYVLVETLLVNGSDKPLVEELADAIRADRVFEFGQTDDSKTFWAYDEWFGQAYGVQVEGYEIKRDKLLLLTRGGESKATIAPGETLVVRRKVFVADHLLALRGITRKAAGGEVLSRRFEVVDPTGPVAHAKVTLSRGETVYGAGRTGVDGTLRCELPAGDYTCVVEAQGRPTVKQAVAAAETTSVKMAACGYVQARVTDGAGQPIPCKVAFFAAGQKEPFPLGKNGKYDPKLAVPYFGPDAGVAAIHNLVYTQNGGFLQEIPPGRYEVIVMCGPEYNAVTTSIDVAAGVPTPLAAKLVRAVDTAGWISADFHSHASPSGDNVSSQVGRVLNLLGEHVEFAPCTEHARVDTYDAALRLLKAERLLATCAGMELTGSPLPINHQNAFPLLHKPRTQNGGGPTTDVNPVTQIARLALWDNKSDKLVQQNHPNLAQILSDKDLDGKADGGFAGMLGFMDVVEVHPPADIFSEENPSKPGSNTMLHWLRLLNLGYRIPGVVNTDAHYNFHGSGWLRNYLRSPHTDDPARINALDVAHEAEAGHVVITNGPFLQAEVVADEPQAKPARGTVGDLIAAPAGKVQLRIRVQCANWLDVNRVQVFANGRPLDGFNFTRRTHPELFADGVVKFSAQLPMKLARDTHLVVATAGEGLTLGRYYGPEFGKAMPVAVGNPIFVDVDGDGFKPNGDLLGLK